MKKIFIVCICIIPTFLWGEELLPHTEKTRSVNFNLVSLHYNWELPLSRLTTVNLHGGMGNDLRYERSHSWDGRPESYWAFAVRGVIGADFRYYHNLDKRVRKGMNTSKNSGNFFSAAFFYVSPAIYEVNMETTHTFVFLPNYGIKRVFKSGWLIEARVGYGVSHDTYGWDHGFHLNFNLGYSF